jgi:5-methylcytosine-specific restriction protein A
VYSSKALTEQRRPSAHKRGYTRKWAEYSKARLRRHPLCVGYPLGYHGERVVEATVTDHIESAGVAPHRFWDEKNHQSLCDRCNKVKAIEEEGGFGH